MAKKFICNEEPIVMTKAGQVRGYVLDGTYTFHGIKYADAQRFQMPQPVAPWEGIKDATSYGFVCPLMNQEVPNGEIMVPHRYWPQNEHCQYLNVWSQSLDPNAKKPVLVWLHGGGFSAGSSIEQVAYEGENMSKHGDVVVVSINHRLNVLGYLDLSPFGEKYANSANAGSADMVAALQWIHENIAAFGGDPENVTLFGQSGGGMKVWTLMNTPAADGLFHKGVVQSGVIDGLGFGVTDEEPKPQNGKAIVTAIMAELGVDNVEALETVPYQQLADAYNKVAMPLRMTGEYVGGNPMANEWYVGDPRQVGFTDHAKTIPVMIGTVLAEFAFGTPKFSKYDKTEEELTEMISAKYGAENTEKLVSLFKAAYPGKNLFDLTSLDTMFRAPSMDFIAKAAEVDMAVYSYIFAYDFPIYGGKAAWHCSEIPFVFRNTELVPVCNEPGVSDKLEEQIFSAWVNFARHGNPGNPALPDWPACKPGDEATMIFDKVCEVRHNHDAELIPLLKEVTPPFVFGAPSDDNPIQH